MTNTIVDLAIILALRNRGIYNVNVLDTMEEDNALQVWFYDRSRKTLVLTEPITSGEACDILVAMPTKRRRMIVKAYSL